MASKLPHEPQLRPIHFFKIILAHSLHEGKLMIPRRFVEKYGEGLPKTVFLKPPNGAEWKLNLVKCDGEIWFQKGWKEFAEYHSLAQGHLLVFRYERTSHFQVHIFDMGALEIDYPFKREEGKRASNDQGNKPPDVENLEDYIPGQTRKDNSALELLQPCKTRNSRHVKFKSTLKLPKAALHHTGRKCKEEPMTTAKQATALYRASSFEPCNPSFLVVMHPSYVHSCGPVNLPSKFCKRHFDLDKKRGDINLQVSNGRVWPVRYLTRKINTSKKFELSRGWKPFAKGNNLKVGDVCTFELIDRTKLTFKVYIFREKDNSDCPTSQGGINDMSALEIEYPFKGVEGKRASNDQGNKLKMVENLEDYRPGQKRKSKSSLELSGRSDKIKSTSNLPKAALHNTTKKHPEKPMTTAKPVTALDRASSFKTCNPSFLVIMRPSYVHSRCLLSLPSKFCKRHFDLDKKRGDINLQVSNGRLWPARYLIRESRTNISFGLSSGWKPFVKSNNLKVGDVCTFELIPRTKLTFQVYIFRKTDNSDCSTPQESAQMRAACQGLRKETKSPIR